MSIRGVYGFRKYGVDFTTYNYSDSYPECLGRKMLEFCATTSIKELNAICNRIVLVDEGSTPTPEQIVECAEFTNLSVGERKNTDWYCLLRGLQGKPEEYKNIVGNIYMTDSAGFIRDSLFCEYGYIINLDSNVLEFWIGFQKEQQTGNRYGVEPCDGYYPCKLAKEIPLYEITWERVDKIVAQMVKVGEAE